MLRLLNTAAMADLIEAEDDETGAGESLEHLFAAMVTGDVAIGEGGGMQPEHGGGGAARIAQACWQVDIAVDVVAEDHLLLLHAQAGVAVRPAAAAQQCR